MLWFSFYKNYWSGVILVFWVFYYSNKLFNTNIVDSMEDYSRSWWVLQGVVASVSEGTIKAYGFNRSAIGIGMEVVVELKNGNNPYIDLFFKNL